MANEAEIKVDGEEDLDRRGILALQAVYDTTGLKPASV